MYREENIFCAEPRARYRNIWGSDHVKHSPTSIFSYPETHEKVHSQDQPSFEDLLLLPHILLLLTFQFDLLEGV
jgi:hypothetical protein